MWSRWVAVTLIASFCAQSYALHVPSSHVVSSSSVLKRNRVLGNVPVPKAESAMTLRGGQAAVATSSLNENIELSVLFGLWYIGNIAYNDWNKQALNLVGGSKGGLVWTISMLQLFVGVLWCIPMWLFGIRSSPNLSAEKWYKIAPIGVFSAGAHGSSVIGLGAGAVSFAQILKAMEPAFSAVTEAIMLKDIQAWQVYATLIPIIGGVSLASLNELSFSWLAVISCMVANQCAAFKAVVSKGVMKEPWAKAMGVGNQYGVVNIASTLTLLPIVLALEGPGASSAIKGLSAKGVKPYDVLYFTLMSGVAFYLYNEVSFMALSKVSPVTHSVANTLKRVVIIVYSCWKFKTPMTREGAIGSTIAIAGTLFYSLAKTKYASHGH